MSLRRFVPLQYHASMDHQTLAMKALPCLLAGAPKPSVSTSTTHHSFGRTEHSSCSHLKKITYVSLSFKYFFTGCLCFLFVLCVVRDPIRALSMLCRCPTTELWSYIPSLFLFFDLSKFTRMVWSLWSSCISLPRSWDYKCTPSYHVQIYYIYIALLHILVHIQVPVNLHRLISKL